jgi:stage II sporulation protein D
VIIAGTSLDVINELSLETYLRAVAPAEMPSSWPVEARIAQTIAARSYAVAHLHPSSGTFDVYDDTRSQVYGGTKRETAAADAVVTATAGQVLKAGSVVANAFFHSTGGGATEHNENSFTSSSGAKTSGVVSYLRGSADRDANGASYDAAAPYATWHSRAYSIAELSAIFAKDSRTNVGTLTGLDLRNRGVSGRLVSVTLVGSGGIQTVSGTLFASIFNANNAAADPNLMSALIALAPIP